MRTNFLKRRDETSYYVVDVLIDIKAYLRNQITHRNEVDSDLKNTAEDIIVQAFKKNFVRSQPYQYEKKGEEGKNNALESISSMIEILAEIEEVVGGLKLDGDMHEEKTLKSLVPERIRKLKEEIETLEMQALAIIQD